MRYKAPDNCDGINIGGEYFGVDKKGFITVPDEGNYDQLVRPHGFLPIDEVKAAAAAAQEAASNKSLDESK